MNNWNGTELCEKSINIVIDSLKRNRDAFTTIQKRNSIYLHYNKKILYRCHKSKCLKEGEDFNILLPLITNIRKNIDRYIDRHKDDLEILEPNNNIIIKREKNFKNLDVDCIFVEIDIQEAYFQTMFKLGYISPQLYYKYSHFEEYKNAYIYGITWLQSDEIVREYQKGKIKKEYNKFRPEYKVIYDNIRYFINGLTDEAMNCCTKKGFLKKKVDAIYCDLESSKNVYNFFYDHGIEIKITHLIKRDDYHYVKAGEIKKF